MSRHIQNTPVSSNKSIVKRLGGQNVVVFLIVAALFAFFCIVSPNFRRYSTILSILDYSYYITLIAIGVTFPLITGGVDLSIGTGLICYSLIGGYLVVYQGWPVWAGMIVCVLCGALIGLLNGFLVGTMNLPPFLATLCTMMMTRGLGSICSTGLGIPWPTAGTEGGWFRTIFKLNIGDLKLPLGFLWILLLTALMSFVLNHTKVGRYIIAIGSNKEATRLSGINTKYIYISAYVISGIFAGFAAIAYSAIFASVYPGTGAGFELEGIGGAIIGGVSMTGGVGSVTGTLIGVFVICILKTGLPFIGLQANWQQIITGVVLITAVLIDLSRNVKGRKVNR
jgi:ribose transport system permease protein